MTSINRVRDAEIFRARTGEYPVGMYIKWLKDGALDFDADYQRDYVWGHEEQHAFLQGLISGFPLGYVALARAPDWASRDGAYIEVVDGKQRLTTLWLFINNKIPLELAGVPVFWQDLTRGEQLAFGAPTLTAVVLDDATPQDRLDYFIAVNFTGMPQSDEHKHRVLALKGTTQ